MTTATASFQLTLTIDEIHALRCLLAWEKETPRVPPACNKDLKAIGKQLDRVLG